MYEYINDLRFLFNRLPNPTQVTKAQLPIRLDHKIYNINNIVKEYTICICTMYIEIFQNCYFGLHFFYPPIIEYKTVFRNYVRIQ